MTRLLRWLFAKLFPLYVAVGVRSVDGQVTRLNRPLLLRPLWMPTTMQCRFYHNPYEFSLYQLGDPIPKTSIIGVVYWIPLWRFGVWRGGERMHENVMDQPMPIDLERRGTTATIQYGDRPAFVF